MIDNYDPLNNPFGYMPEVPGMDGLTEEEQQEVRIKAMLCGCGATALGFVLAMLLCLLFGSCATTRYVPVIEHKTDTLLYYSSTRDSICLHDSIYVSDFVRDDTVWRTEYKWRTRYIERVSHDTTYISKRDTIPVPYEVIKEVPRKRSKAEWLLMVSGLAALIGATVYAVKKVKPFLSGL